MKINLKAIKKPTYEKKVKDLREGEIFTLGDGGHRFISISLNGSYGCRTVCEMIWLNLTHKKLTVVSLQENYEVIVEGTAEVEMNVTM